MALPPSDLGLTKIHKDPCQEPPASSWTQWFWRHIGDAALPRKVLKLWKMESVEKGNCGKWKLCKMEILKNENCGKGNCGKCKFRKRKLWKMEMVENGNGGKWKVFKIVENGNCGITCYLLLVTCFFYFLQIAIFRSCSASHNSFYYYLH